MATVIWFFDQLYVPKELRFDEFAVLPLSAEDCALHEAAKSFAASFGREFTFASWRTPIVDMVAIVLRGIEATEVDEALSSTASRAMAVATALVYSQFGRGRPLGAFVDLGNGEYEARYVRADYRKTTNVPIVSEQEELLRVLDAFTDHPQAKVLADLFSEACRDTNPSAAIARLWLILEALAERFPGRKHQKVARALSHLGIANPMVRGRTLTQRAYKVRNELMHEGRLDASGATPALQAEFSDLVWFALRRSGLREVDPTGTYMH
ncbi:MAG: hypothetical protein ABSD62_05215 [Candidatus Limnocylindrales bacterium]|jgi:nitrogen regulatory protein PII